MKYLYIIQNTWKNTRILVFLCIFSFFSSQILFSEENVFLQIDPGAHTSEITDIVVTSDKKFAVTGSTDKTIRVWDLDEKKEVRKLSGDIGPGNNGKINAIALTPDDRYLVVGGYLGDYNSKNTGDVRVFDYKTGNVIKVLSALKAPVTDIAISSDGKYLAASDEEGSITVWNLDKNFSLYSSYKFHENKVNAIAFFIYNGKHNIVSGGDDYYTYVYSLSEKKKIEEMRTYLMPVTAISVNESRQWIIIGKKVMHKDEEAWGYLLRYSLKQIIFFGNMEGNEPLSIVSSPDGNYIITAVKGEDKRVVLQEYREKKNEYMRVDPVMEFPEIEGSVKASAFIDNTRVLIAGGKNNEVYIWDIKKGTEEQLSIGNPGIRELGIDNSKIFIGYEKSIKKNKYSISFDLNSFTVSDDASDVSSEDINTISSKYKEYSLYRDALKKDGRSYAALDLDFEYEEYYPKGFTDAGNVVVGGPEGKLGVYNKYGKKYAELLGHTGSINSLALYKNMLVSGSEDRIIHFWNLDELDNKEVLYPYLSLFLSPDGEWVLWSNKGYYISSMNGDSLVYYHVNRGNDKKAEHYDFERFYKTYYRPDIIEKIIRLQSSEKGLDSVSSLAPAFSSEKILPPEILFPDISSQSIQAGGKEIAVNFKVLPNSNSPIEGVTIHVNGTMLKTDSFSGGTATAFSSSVIVPLERKTTILSITAKNKFAVSKPKQLIILKNDNIPEKIKPRLYILSIGVSKYKNPEISLSFADKDAESVALLFEKQNGKEYSDVEKKVLLNTQATKTNITKELSLIGKKVTRNDSVIVFLAGHGVNNADGDYYFLSHDADLNNLSETAIPWNDFKREILSIPANVIFIVDTCHSGSIWGGTSKNRNALVGAVKSITSEGAGPIIMTAATTDDSSFENSTWGHGAFTFAMLEAISDEKADFNKDAVVTLKEFDLYISNRVSNLTKGSQRPTTIIPQSMPDFPVARLQ